MNDKNSSTRNNQVSVVDTEEQVLFSCSLENVEEAYQFAREMEDLGVEVFIKTPSLPETLAQSLGAEPEELQTIRDAMDEEISAHIPGEKCCPTAQTSNMDGLSNE